jgi:thiamine transport system permease protein
MTKKALFWPGVIAAIVLLGIAVILGWTLIDASASGETVRLSAYIWSLLGFTIYQAALSTLISIILGLVLAWSLNRQALLRGRAWLVTLFSSSLVLPSMLVAFGIISVLGNHGWINRILSQFGFHSLGSYVYGLSGILIAHVYLNASYASISLLHSLESIPLEKYRLSKSLGLGPWRRFVYIEWQAIKGVLPSVATVIFLLCFSSFAIVLLLGGNPSYNTLEVAIYEAVRMDFDIPQALKIASLQLMISVVLVLFSSSFHGGLANLKQDSSIVPWEDSRGYALFQKIFIWLCGFIYILPIVAILADGFYADYAQILSRSIFWRSFLTSIGLAAISSILTILFAIALAQLKADLQLKSVSVPGQISRSVSTVVSLAANIYLAVPTMIMGVGFFLIAQHYGGSRFWWAISAIIVANVLMSLPFSFAVISPTVLRVEKRYNKLADSISLGFWARWRHARWPYMKHSVLYIGALSFAMSLGDLGVISLFGNREITTLPWYLYQLMGSYHNNDARGVAVVLLLLVSVLFAMINLYKKKAYHA